MAPEKSWKVDEREVARRLGGRRIALSGGRGALSRADVVTDRLFVEVKRRAGFPALAWYAKTRYNARAEGKIPVVVVHVTGTDQWLAIISLDDLVVHLDVRDDAALVRGVLGVTHAQSSGESVDAGTVGRGGDG